MPEIYLLILPNRLNFLRLIVGKRQGRKNWYISGMLWPAGSRTNTFPQARMRPAEEDKTVEENQTCQLI